jgi:hypothetical protein
MPLVQTRGAASAQGFGEFAQASAVPNYIEEVFSCFLYTGTGSAQTITNGIDLSTKGGLTWIKGRSGATGHRLTDTARGVTKSLASETTAAEATETTGLTAFGTTGFTIGADADYNTSAATYVSWTFREQAKFFDVVTYTGTGSNTTIAHSLGAVPGSIIVKRTDTTGDWQVYHRSLANTEYLVLNSTAAKATGATRWNSTTPTSAVFSVGTDATVNASAGTYVAYVFAHDSGGFGLTGTDNVISCGSFSTDVSGNFSVNLGYEPQWILAKQSSGSANNWRLFDNMRGMSNTNVAGLIPNSSAAESDFASPYCVPSATGFFSDSGGFFDASQTVIYIAIRRGPMKVPTSGTSVFLPSTAPATTPFNVGFPPDMALWAVRDGTGNREISARLQGGSLLYANSGVAESSGYNIGWDSKTNFWYQDVSGGSMINWLFRRAPSFFDAVFFTGTNGVQALTHNLTVVPELILCKRRSAGADSWRVYSATVGNTACLILNGTNTPITSTSFWNDTSPTTTQFTTAGHFESPINYVAYLFATCTGVSKVGSYTGNGTTQTINCGFGAGGARYVLLKRTDVAASWYAYDTARGMTLLTDPYLIINSTAAESATLGSVTTVSTGFALDSAILADINVSAGTYIFLAIA